MAGDLTRRLPLVGPFVRHRDALAADRDSLLDERAALAARNTELHDAQAAAGADIERLNTQSAGLVAEFERLTKDFHAALDQRSALYAERDLVTEQRNALQHRFDALTVEHHRVVSEHQRLSVLHDDPRAYLADRFLSGDGIEIGALHRPTTVPETARVRYLDRCGVADLRAEYPELHTVALVEPDLLDDGERLAAIPFESLDFIIANHFLEHCEDPIGTLETFRNRLRPSGRLFLAVPDMRRTFDSRRPVTTLDHLVCDHVEGPEGSRAAHYDEYVALVEDRHGDEHTMRRDALMTQRYPIHFHTFTPTSLRSLLAHCNFSVLADLEHDDEVIVVAGA